jgi:hypothetical protein
LEKIVKRLGLKIAVIFLLGLTGCGWVINRMAPDAVRDAKNYYEQLRQRQVEQIVQAFDPIADKNDLRGNLQKVIALVPEEEPLGTETLGASAECKGSGVCTKLIILEYKYPDRWILFRITVSNRSGHYAITNLYVEPESKPIASMSQFTFRGKGMDHYMIVFLALLSAGIAIFALVLCIRTPIRKRKWLWIIINILGLGKLGIEWTNGALWYKVAYISILPVGFGFDSESPFIYASIPAGAILFLLLRRRLAKASATAPPTNWVVPSATIDQGKSESEQ